MIDLSILFYPKNLRDYSSLFEVAIAYGAAYLAFDRFRLKERFIEIKLSADETLEKIVGKLPQMPFRDKFHKSYQDKIDNITDIHQEKWKGPLWFRGFYDPEDGPSHDKRFILIITIFNIYLLVLSNYVFFEVDYWEATLILLSPLLGIIFSSCLVFSMKKIVSQFRSEVDAMLDDAKSYIGKQYDALLSARQMVIMMLKDQNRINDLIMLIKEQDYIKEIIENDPELEQVRNHPQIKVVL